MHACNLFVILFNLFLFCGVLVGVIVSKTNEYDFSHVDRVILDGIKEKAYPGAVVLIGNKDGILYQNAYGHHTYDSDAKKVQTSTLFDLASLTKVIATTTAVAQLYQKNLLTLDMKVASIFPEFGNHGKEDITLEHLLLHNSGFHPDPIPGFYSEDFGCPETSKHHPDLSFSCISKIYDSIMNQELQNPVGLKYVYSDLSMMTAHLIVGKIVETNKLVSEHDLRSDCPTHLPGSEVCFYEAYVRKHVVEPLNLNHTQFRPNPSDWSNCAPAWNESNIYRHELIQGFVSDPNSYANGGIMGHAGLFSTAEEVFQIGKAWLFQTHPDYLNKETFSLFTKVPDKKQSSRALGWDTNLSGFGSCGHLSPSTFLHLGYTGTQICNDPDRGIVTLFFTNRVFPTEENNKQGKYRALFNDAVLCALENRHC